MELNTDFYTTYSLRLQTFFPQIAAHQTNLHQSRTLLKESSYPRIDLTDFKLNSGRIFSHNGIRPWCQEQFGYDWIWAGDMYYFKNESDLAWFTLKWL